MGGVLKMGEKAVDGTQIIRIFTDYRNQYNICSVYLASLRGLFDLIILAVLSSVTVQIYRSQHALTRQRVRHASGLTPGYQCYFRRKIFIDDYND